MGQRPQETQATTSLSIQVRSALMSYLYDMVTDKELPTTHYCIRYRRDPNECWSTMTYKYSDYGTVHTGALQYINILQHHPQLELYIFRVENGHHTLVHAYHSTAS